MIPRRGALFVGGLGLIVAAVLAYTWRTNPPSPNRVHVDTSRSAVSLSEIIESANPLRLPPPPRQPRPGLPYEDRGACPFECCTYREWDATRTLPVLTEHRTDAPVAFVLQKGDRIQAVTGVVITTKFGTAVSHTPENKNPFVVIHGEGEGYWLCWFDGSIQEMSMSTAEQCRGPDGRPDCEIEITVQPQTSWWAQVRRSDGLTGWVLMENDPFDNTDACG